MFDYYDGWVDRDIVRLLGHDDDTLFGFPFGVCRRRRVEKISLFIDMTV